MSPHQISSTCSDSSTRHLSIIKEVAKTPDAIANSIAFNDLKQDYKDAIQCIISLEKHVLNLEDRIIQMSLELASAKASEDLINLKEARSRRRSTSDVATTPPPDPTLLVSWQGVDDIDDDIMPSASDDDNDADSEVCPPAPPSPLPTPQKSNKKMLRRASVAICAPSQPPSLPKFGARRRTTTDLSHQHQKSRLHRVSWPGVDEADTYDEDEGCTSSPPPPPQKQQPPIKKLFRRCSLSMGDHHVEVDIVPKADTTNRQTFTKSLSGRRIVVESTDEPSDISDSFVPRSSSHLNNNCRDDVSNSQHHLDESASSKGFDLRQLFAKQKQGGRNSDDTDEENCRDSPISTNKNKIDTNNSSRNRGGCGAEGGLDESSSSRLFGQLFQRKNSRTRASTPTTTVKKEEVDTRGDINRRIAFHKERAALLNDESDRFLA